VTNVSGQLVSFRGTYVFEEDGAILISDSTLRFRGRDEVADSLLTAGFAVAEVRDAPDRPGREYVFVAVRALPKAGNARSAPTSEPAPGRAGSRSPADMRVRDRGELADQHALLCALRHGHRERVRVAAAVEQPEVVAARAASGTSSA
jgi:hypothetical protein